MYRGNFLEIIDPHTSTVSVDFVNLISVIRYGFVIVEFYAI